MSINDDPDENKAPLLEHLADLRNCLVISAGALLVAMIGCYFFAEQIYNFLMRPLADAMGGPESGRRMIATSLTETFFTYLKIAFFAGVAVAFPVIAYQAYKFVAPGLYRNERRAFLPFLVAGPTLFIAGAAMVYYLIFPVAWRFFLGFETHGGDGVLPIQVEARVSEYLSLVLALMFAFGLCFQLPVALTLLARVGILTAAHLVKFRRYAIVLVFVVAAVLTPPDVLSQLSLAVPGIILYEVSILLIRLMERNRAKEKAEAEE